MKKIYKEMKNEIEGIYIATELRIIAKNNHITLSACGASAYKADILENKIVKIDDKYTRHICLGR
jgi:hypothetical protein